jgi:hypothetical protein
MKQKIKKKKNKNPNSSTPPLTNVRNFKANVTRNGPKSTKIKLIKLFDQLEVNKKWIET